MNVDIQNQQPTLPEKSNHLNNVIEQYIILQHFSIQLPVQSMECSLLFTTLFLKGQMNKIIYKLRI